MNDGHKPKLAVYKFASCDGCQLSLLDCEDELLTIAESGLDKDQLTPEAKKVGITRLCPYLVHSCCVAYYI